MSKSSKSLPSNFKQKQIESANRSGSLSISDILINNASSLSSSVKKPSPLRFNSTDYINDSSTATSDKSWMTKRWSTVSGSLIMKRRHQKLAAKKLWMNRQKRRTYPPSKDILKLEEKTLRQIYIHHNNSKKKLSSRQSLQDILSTFYNQGESVSSSTSSFRISKILKKKGKQPYRKRLPPLVVNNENQLFQPPPTISSTKSSNSTPLKFPTPPKRFSAFYVDLAGKRGKVDYYSPKPKKHQSILNLLQHGTSQELPLEEKYDRQLSMDATLFLFGFLFFPLWWIGAYLYFYRKREELTFYNDNDLFSIRTFAYLNGIFSFLSLGFIILIIALIIWLVNE